MLVYHYHEQQLRLQEILKMPSEMTTQELETSLASATQVDTYEFRNEDDEDDYFTATLYKARDGRHFRVVDSSGMNSQFDGSSGFGQRLTDKEVKNWNEF